jgi:hypothetical protein
MTVKASLDWGLGSACRADQGLPKLAGVPIQIAVANVVLVECDAGMGPAHQLGGSLALLDWQPTQIPAVNLDQAEGTGHGSVVVRASAAPRLYA